MEKFKKTDFQKWAEYSGIFKNIQECSGIFRNILEYSGIFRNILEYSRIFKNIPEYSRIFKNILEYSWGVATWGSGGRKGASGPPDPTEKPHCNSITNS